MRNYNTFDHSWHGTSDERRASTDLVTVEGTRFYDINEGIYYMSDSTYWRVPGEGCVIGGLYQKDYLK